MNDESALAKTLFEIKKNDRNYPERETLVYMAAGLSAKLGYHVGIRIDEGWPVVTIKLPMYGQVSWHIKPDQIIWDGHDTIDKYQRIDFYVDEYYNKSHADWYAWRTWTEDERNKKNN